VSDKKREINLKPQSRSEKVDFSGDFLRQLQVIFQRRFHKLSAKCQGSQYPLFLMIFKASNALKN
jgi:hypothetical protein